MKDDFYFKHDIHASQDQKITRLLKAHGWEAYGLYWALVERLYCEGGNLEDDYETLAYGLRTDAGKIKALVTKFGLFYVNAGKIGSQSVDRRLEERIARAEEGRKSAHKRWRNGGSPIGNPKGSQWDPNARRGEEIEREKEITTAETAPLAVGKSIKQATTKTSQRILEVKLKDARLPFEFGSFPKGSLIQELPKDACTAILGKLPRLGKGLSDLLKARMAQINGDRIRKN